MDVAQDYVGCNEQGVSLAALTGKEGHFNKDSPLKIPANMSRSFMIQRTLLLDLGEWVRQRILGPVW